MGCLHGPCLLITVFVTLIDSTAEWNANRDTDGVNRRANTLDWLIGSWCPQFSRWLSMTVKVIDPWSSDRMIYPQTQARWFTENNKIQTLLPNWIAFVIKIQSGSISFQIHFIKLRIEKALAPMASTCLLNDILWCHCCIWTSSTAVMTSLVNCHVLSLCVSPMCLAR